MVQLKKKILSWFLLGVSVLFCVLGIYWQYFIQTTINVSKSGELFFIKRGSSLHEIAKNLENKEIINSSNLLIILARLKFNHLEQKIKAGEYQLTATMTPGDLLQKIYSGKIYYHDFIIKEGEVFSQLLSRIKKVKTLKHQLPEEKQQKKILRILGLAEHSSPEGLFFPETYHYARGTSDRYLLIRAHRELMRFLDKEWLARDKKVPYKNSYQALTMASIIEKESSEMVDRKKVSSVFANRLKINMRLQADPTVIYGLRDQYSGRLTRKQLRIPTKYNTYLNYGLPPTPIAMVSLGAIHATLQPIWGKDLYFVADGKGQHIFSKSLQEHNKAVKKRFAK